jgi:hypothetical protein
MMRWLQIIINNVENEIKVDDQEVKIENQTSWHYRRFVNRSAYITNKKY